jgi:hypothetical protein
MEASPQQTSFRRGEHRSDPVAPHYYTWNLRTSLSRVRLSTITICSHSFPPNSVPFLNSPTAQRSSLISAELFQAGNQHLDVLRQPARIALVVEEFG